MGRYLEAVTGQLTELQESNAIITTAAIVAALNRLDKDKQDVMQTLRAGLQLALGTQDDDGFNETAIQNRIAELQGVMMDLAELSFESSAGADYNDTFFICIGQLFVVV